jgi:hypothetical protein
LRQTSEGGRSTNYEFGTDSRQKQWERGFKLNYVDENK